MMMSSCKNSSEKIKINVHRSFIQYQGSAIPMKRFRTSLSCSHETRTW